MVNNSIQWFPGHMHKARKEIEEAIPQVDVIIEVLDARIPFSSENPLISQRVFLLYRFVCFDIILTNFF